MLDCELVKGEVRMGVRPALPIEGIAVILGNGLAGSRVWADVPPPPVLTSSCFSVQPECFQLCSVMSSAPVMRTVSRARTTEFSKPHHEKMDHHNRKLDVAPQAKTPLFSQLNVGGLDPLMCLLSLIRAADLMRLISSMGHTWARCAPCLKARACSSLWLADLFAHHTFVTWFLVLCLCFYSTTSMQHISHIHSLHYWLLQIPPIHSFDLLFTYFG